MKLSHKIFWLSVLVLSLIAELVLTLPNGTVNITSLQSQYTTGEKVVTDNTTGTSKDPLLSSLLDVMAYLTTAVVVLSALGFIARAP